MSEDYRGITKNLFTFAAGENRAELEHLSKQYGHTKDLEALAKLAEMGLKQLGFEKEGSDIAKRLRKKRKDDKPSRWMMYRGCKPLLQRFSARHQTNPPKGIPNY